MKVAFALSLILVSSSGLVSSGAEPGPTPSPAPPRSYPERLRWWADGRFGLFIHWGPVSLKGTEISWSRANTNPKCPNNGPIPAEIYDNLYREFDPKGFDAREWVSLAQAAGIKYMVLTVKHCDGFLQAFPELKRIRKFAIEYWEAGRWKACYQGEDLGARLTARFEPVTAQRVRLDIIESTDGPTIWEFQLLR